MASISDSKNLRMIRSSHLYFCFSTLTNVLTSKSTIAIDRLCRQSRKNMKLTSGKSKWL